MTMNRTTFAIALLLSSACYGQSLRKAVETSNVERVRELLESGANANTTYENGYTPIYFAEDPRIVDLLLAHGAKLNMRSAGSYQSPIESAADNWYFNVKRRDEWKAIVNRLRDAGAEYTIDTATYMNDIPFVQEALEKDDSWVNKSRGAQSVPLRVAARTGRLEICKLLLDHKADPDSFEEGNGYPIIYDAVQHPAIVQLLVERNANLKRRITWMGGRSGVWLIGDEGSALHYAVSAGKLESVKILADAGLDPNAADNKGQTPLHIAIRFERWDKSWGRDTSPFPKIIQYLLDNDASLALTTKGGQSPHGFEKELTPLELAKELGSPKEIIQALQKRQKEIDQAFRRAMLDGR
jgi:ankyrin repeat protein